MKNVYSYFSVRDVSWKAIWGILTSESWIESKKQRSALAYHYFNKYVFIHCGYQIDVQKRQI